MELKNDLVVLSDFIESDIEECMRKLNIRKVRGKLYEGLKWDRRNPLWSLA